MRYFFDFDDGGRLIEDEIGVELPDLGAVRRAALDTLPAVACDAHLDGEHHEFAVNVRTQNGDPVLKAKLALSAEWCGRHSSTPGI